MAKPTLETNGCANQFSGFASDGASCTGVAGFGFGTAGFLAAGAGCGAAWAFAALAAGPAAAGGRGAGEGVAVLSGGRAGTTGSGVMMLTGGIEAELGKSAVVGLPVGACGCVRPAMAGLDGAFQVGE